LKWDLDAVALLFAIDSASEKRYLPCKRVDRDVGQQLLNERLTPGTDLRRVGPLDPMYQLDQSNRGKRRFPIPAAANTSASNCATV
jgi:hypothetical protein